MLPYVNVTLSNLSPLTHYVSYQSNNMEGKGNVGEAISVSFTSSNALVAAIEDYYYGGFKVKKVRQTTYLYERLYYWFVYVATSYENFCNY